MNPIAGTTQQLQAIHPEIPPEKLGSMVARSFLGGFFVLLGLGLLVVLVGLPAISAFRAGTQPSLSLLALGFGVVLPVALCILGANVWSSQLVAKPIALTVAAFKGIWQTVRGNAPQS